MHRVYQLVAQQGRWQLTRGGKPVMTGKGHPLETGDHPLAEATLAQLCQPRPRVFLLGFWQAVLDAETPEINHMRATLREGLAHDQLLYPAPTPADLVAQQQQAWQAALTWLAGKNITPSAGQWQGEGALTSAIDALALEALVWAYGASRLLQSTALGLWGLQSNTTTQDLLKAGYSDELYQQTRYRPDDEVAARLARIEADLADLCLIRRLGG